MKQLPEQLTKLSEEIAIGRRHLLKAIAATSSQSTACLHIHLSRVSFVIKPNIAVL